MDWNKIKNTNDFCDKVYLILSIELFIIIRD